ncbi:protein CYPRO4-like [Wolffia australiana]
MGGSQSREGERISDSEEEEEEVDEVESSTGNGSSGDSSKISAIDDTEKRLRSLSLKYSQASPSSQVAKLYIHVGGSAPDARWMVSEKIVSFSFRKSSLTRRSESDDEEGSASWFLKVGSKIWVRVDQGMKLKDFPEQLRVDFVASGVWALKFPNLETYQDFYNEYQNCLFENIHGLEANEENKLKIYGKDFMGWVKPELADETIWADAEEKFEKSPFLHSPIRPNLLKEFEEVADDEGIQSLALGALENSFLVSDSGIQVVKNFSHGIHGKGMTVKLSDGRRGPSNYDSSTQRKALLMKAETNMLVMNSSPEGKARSGGLHQVDIETGKSIGRWRFEKDGTGIWMKDLANDTKDAQLDPSQSTFLGLDDNTLCRWDMRVRSGMVQTIGKSNDSPVLEWSQGHQFSRGTDFQCFATTGDGSIVVGSLDGRIRLYSKSSMRTAKTAFPGLGSPITHIDVTFDGRWILGTTDTYLVLISTVFRDKDGKEKTGFSGRMGNRIAAPRLLKLSPLDSQLAGENSKFKGGHFSWVTEGGKQERHLVATAGKFSVVWNFAQVKDGQHGCYRLQKGLKSCYCYKIVPRDESIVDSRFMHEKFATGVDSQEAPLVVATPLKVSSFTFPSS